MKQNLNIGAVVDDGTGDYLREGGLKINSNNDDIYYELGDGDNLHSAGAWKTIDTNIDAEFGKSYTVDTSKGPLSIKLPKGSAKDYNKVIRIRDVFATWQINPVTVVPALTDTLKGLSTSQIFDINLTDLELVYCSPGRWEYIPNKRLNKFSSDDISSVIRKEFIATEGQIDFIDIFDGNVFNIANTQVFHRGNLLYYGEEFSENSDYGSPTDDDLIGPLDGKSIRFREQCVAGDSVIIVTYLDGIAQWRSTYNRLSVTLLDSSKTEEVSVSGSTIVTNLSELKSINVADLGYSVSSESGMINPNTLEVYINGVILNEAGSSGLPLFRCDGVDASNMADCELQNGAWVQSNTDYSYDQADSGAIESINFDRTFEHGDIVTIKWYNNIIGTTLSIDEIIDTTDQYYIKQGGEVNLTGTIRITDYDNPAWPNVEENGATVVNIDSPFNMFDLIYPIGTIYENAVNPNNPSTYMGFGTWKLWGETKVTVGWTNDKFDLDFGQNNNDLDVNDVPSNTAGGTGGNRTITLSNSNIPALQSDKNVLVSDENGNIIIGGCQFDPDDQGPAYNKYTETKATINSETQTKEFNILQPYITVYRWMRIS